MDKKSIQISALDAVHQNSCILSAYIPIHKNNYHDFKQT